MQHIIYDGGRNEQRASGCSDIWLTAPVFETLPAIGHKEWKSKLSLQSAALSATRNWTLSSLPSVHFLLDQDLLQFYSILHQFYSQLLSEATWISRAFRFCQCPLSMYIRKTSECCSASCCPQPPAQIARVSHWCRPACGKLNKWTVDCSRVPCSDRVLQSCYHSSGLKCCTPRRRPPRTERLLPESRSNCRTHCW